LNDTRPGHDADWQRRQTLQLEDAIRETVLELRTPYRAVTATDFERLALEVWPQSAEAGRLGVEDTIGRAHCVPQRNLETDRQGKAPAAGHVSLVIVPGCSRGQYELTLDNTTRQQVYPLTLSGPGEIQVHLQWSSPPRQLQIQLAPGPQTPLVGDSPLEAVYTVQPQGDSTTWQVTVSSPGEVAVKVTVSLMYRPFLPTLTLRSRLQQWLDTRRLLGTCLHVVAPAYVPVAIKATLVLRDDYAPAQLKEQQTFLDNDAIVRTVRQQAAAALRAYFHPLTGGPNGQGWPFGRRVYRSEIYQVLDALPGVDYVAEVDLRTDDTTRYRQDGMGKTNTVVLAAHELVSVTVTDDFTVEIFKPEQHHGR
jgi:hypothetical protein